MMTLVGVHKDALELEVYDAESTDAAVVADELDVADWPMAFVPKKPLRLRFGKCWTWLAWYPEEVTPMNAVGVGPESQ